MNRNATHPKLIDSSNTSRIDMIVSDSESPPEGIVSHGTVQFAGQESQLKAQPNLATCTQAS